MEGLAEIEQKKNRIQELTFQIISDNDMIPAKAAEQITAVIMAKRMHIDGMNGLVALQQHWTEAQCRLLIEMLS